VTSADRVVRHVIESNVELAQNIADDILACCVSRLFICSPIKDGFMPELEDIESAYASVAQQSAAALVDLLVLCMTNPDPLPKNQLRVISYLSLDSDRLTESVSMSVLRLQDYRDEMIKSTWSSNSLISYHLGLIRLISHTCIGSINITEAKCLTIFQFDELLVALTDMGLTFNVKAYLFHVFYHMAVDAEIKVKFLCHRPPTRTLIGFFAECIAEVCANAMKDAKSFEAILNQLDKSGKLSTAGHDSMLMWNYHEPLLKLDLENLIRLVAVIALPILHKILVRYHEDLNEEYNKQGNFIHKLRESISDLTLVLSNTSVLGPHSLEMYELAQKIVPLIALQTRVIGKLSSAQLTSKHLKLRQLQPQAVTRIELDRKDGTEPDSTSKLTDLKPHMQSEFVRIFLRIKRSAHLRTLQKNEIDVVNQALLHIGRGHTGIPQYYQILRYPNIIYCIIQHVQSSMIECDSGSSTISYRFVDTASAETSLMILKFLRNAIRYIKDKAE
jgi:hypothetical protein